MNTLPYTRDVAEISRKPKSDSVQMESESILHSPASFIDFLGMKGIGSEPILEEDINLTTNLPSYVSVMNKPIHGSCLWALDELSYGESGLFVANNVFMRVPQVVQGKLSVGDYIAARIFFPHRAAYTLCENISSRDDGSDFFTFLSSWSGKQFSNFSDLKKVGLDLLVARPHIAVSLANSGFSSMMGGSYNG